MHWSLGIIDMRLGVVSFYTSLKNRGYFKVFMPKMKLFLEMQTPGMEYQFIELTGQECQPSDSLDCSIYVLNNISQLCVLPDKRVFYTRKSVAAYIKEGLLQQAKNGEWYNFSTDIADFLEKYAGRSGYKERRTKYNEQLIPLLISYEPKRIEDLVVGLFKDGNLLKCREIEAQFKAQLIPKKRKNEEVIDVFT